MGGGLLHFGKLLKEENHLGLEYSLGNGSTTCDPEMMEGRTAYLNKNVVFENTLRDINKA